MMYVRGNPADYDGWAELGCTGWSWKSVFPYFIKSENCSEPSLVSSGYHGTNGLQHVQYPRYVSPMREEFVKAGVEFGWRKSDYNGERQSDTIDYVQYTIDGPSRASTSKEYLMPAKDRKNLHIIQRAFATKVILEANTAKGIEYYRGGQIHTVYANKEVIVSAGSIDTPKLLMLSGIGPASELKKHNIKVVADLPVGIGLQDHPLVPMLFKINKPSTINTKVWKTNETIYEYAKERKGPLTTPGGVAMAFFNPLNASDLPSFQIMWHTFTQEMNTPQHENLLRIVSAVVHPLSRGSVRLKSADWKDPPLIDPNYYGEEVDWTTMLKGLEQLMEYLKTPTMTKYSPELVLDDQPACKEKAGLSGPQLISCIMEQYTQTVYHPVATARMGHPRDPRTVLSPNLTVLGFEKLRVVDASVMPFVTRANTNAPTIMVAEKGADMIRAAHGKASGFGGLFLARHPFLLSVSDYMRRY